MQSYMVNIGTVSSNTEILKASFLGNLLYQIKNLTVFWQPFKNKRKSVVFPKNMKPVWKKRNVFCIEQF